MSNIIDNESLKQIEADIMLAINKSLYRKNIITSDVFEKASEIILRGDNNGLI